MTEGAMKSGWQEILGDFLIWVPVGIVFGLGLRLIIFLVWGVRLG